MRGEYNNNGNRSRLFSPDARIATFPVSIHPLSLSRRRVDGNKTQGERVNVNVFKDDDRGGFETTEG